MPIKPYVPEDDVLKFEFKVANTNNGLDSLLKEASINFELNKIPTAKFSFVASNIEVNKDQLLSSDSLKENVTIEFIITTGKAKKTLFKGKIKSVEKVQNNNSITTKIECKDLALSLTFPSEEKETNDTTFKDKLTKIADKLKVGEGLTGAWENEKITYNTSTLPWDFVVSYLDSIGVLLAVKNGELSGIDYKKEAPTEKYVAENGINVFSFSGKIDESKKIKKVSIEAWDSSSQALKKSDSEQDAPNPNIKTIRLNENNLTEGTIKLMADAILKKSSHTSISGKVSTFGNLNAGIGDFIILNKVNESIDGKKVLISGELHTIENGCWRTEYTLGLESEQGFAANATKNNANPQSQIGQTNLVSGLLIGIVMQIEDDPKKEFRIKVKIPALAENGNGVWARLATLNASNQMGSFFIPNVNDEVILGCFGSNPDTPVILGGLYSSAIKPPYEIKKENYIKAFVTKEGTKIEFDDEKKQIELSTKKGNKILISDDKKGITLEDENKNKIVMNADGILIESAKDIILKAKGDVKIDGVNIKVKASANIELKGSMIKLN
ncbi:phage baseplate assembly protein V [Flavobacterium sp. SUN052]|uniref:phage baseplate assembly protein V n=1 Tax=Flavobacterium sp. SUN052 TaxID=3002441 RepID=UPI00237D5138|nr:phage baseplate assembly protein V [Flavobacterium sp. SUN052]MEC4004869.1 phage baseplate assembly protein V [Flavobacterium sp. SUN052]